MTLGAKYKMKPGVFQFLVGCFAALGSFVRASHPTQRKAHNN